MLIPIVYCFNLVDLPPVAVVPAVFLEVFFSFVAEVEAVVFFAGAAFFLITTGSGSGSGSGVGSRKTVTGGSS